MQTTIVIPVHNKASLTERLLKELTAAPDRPACEILVVDDGSTDATGQVLAGFAGAVTVLRNEANLGFAAACNRGVEEASGELVVLLNNDVRTTPGWLGTLTSYAENHPQAAAVGARLLFPNGVVQHAGVVIGQDCNPYHLYAGFPGDHPAACRSRRFQIVTGACMCVRREVFLEQGGLDTDFVNGHEDVDFCLRLNQAGHEVHLCGDCVLYHLESASRDAASGAAQDNGRLYRERWADRVVPDDLGYYVDDGLLTPIYKDAYPIELQVSPLLAVPETSGDAGRLLQERSAQVFALLRESARLSVELGEAALAGRAGAIAADIRAVPDPASGLQPEREADLDAEVETALFNLQRALARRAGSLVPSRWLEYRGQVQQLRAAVCKVTPPGARVAVVSRGDPRLVDLPMRTGEHLPQDGSGGFAGFYPVDGPEAVESLEAVRARGAGYLAIPQSCRWWLEHYPEFAAHLESVGTPLLPEGSPALVYSLQTGAVSA